LEFVFAKQERFDGWYGMNLSDEVFFFAFGMLVTVGLYMLKQSCGFAQLVVADQAKGVCDEGVGRRKNPSGGTDVFRLVMEGG
jgi:hypothetical protein